MQTLPQQTETMVTSDATQVTLKHQACKAQWMPERKTDSLSIMTTSDKQMSPKALPTSQSNN